MTDILGQLEHLRRPRLLIRAARIGAEDYRRGSRLQRLLGSGHTPRTGIVLMRLMDMEAELDARRQTHDSAYSVSRHVEVLSAMMGEARILRASSH